MKTVKIKYLKIIVCSEADFTKNNYNNLKLNKTIKLSNYGVMCFSS